MRVEVVSGFGPIQAGLGAAVAEGVRIEVGGCGRRSGVVGIGRRGGEVDGSAEGAGVIAKIDGASGEVVRCGGLKETRRGAGDAAADATPKTPSR